MSSVLSPYPAVGVESTVVDCTSDHPIILRPGGVTREQIESVLGFQVPFDPHIVLYHSHPAAAASFVPKAPGMKYTHYAPRAPLYLVEGSDLFVKLLAFAAVSSFFDPQQLQLCPEEKYSSSLLHTPSSSSSSSFVQVSVLSSPLPTAATLFLLPSTTSSSLISPASSPSPPSLHSPVFVATSPIPSPLALPHDRLRRVGILTTEEKLPSFSPSALLTTQVPSLSASFCSHAAESFVVLASGARSDLSSIAHHLFEVLRSFDEQRVDVIFAETFPEQGIGFAIMNRLSKAAGYHFIRETDDTWRIVTSFLSTVASSCFSAFQPLTSNENSIVPGDHITSGIQTSSSSDSSSASCPAPALAPP